MMRRFARGDSGTSLVLVLIIVTAIGLGLTGLLSMMDTNERATIGLRSAVGTTYAADGAMQAAVNSVRSSTYNGATGQNCFGSGNTLSLSRINGTDSAAVACSPDAAKVLVQCPSLSQCNRPGSAILTLGKVAGEDGINIAQPTGSSFLVGGNVFSNSTINVTNGSLTTDARLYARGTCTGTIVATTTSCNYGTTSNALGDDPGYAAATSTVPVHRSLPACTTANSLVTFQPGYYDDAYGLSQMMAGNSACKGSTWWFKPGTYYFDFHNAGTNRNPLLNSSGGNVWTVNDGSLVAGTPVDSTGATISQPPVNPTIPGSCANPIRNATAVGVQFIFGNDSQFAVKSGKAEVCGTYNAYKPPIAVYGLTSGSETTTALTGASTLTPTSVPDAGDFVNGATAANLRAVDGTTASWKSTNKNTSGSLTVSGYAPASAIPEGSILQSASIRVTHQHTDTLTTDGLSATLTPNGGTATVSGSATGRLGGLPLSTDVISLDSAQTGALAQAVYKGTFTGAKIALAVTLANKNDTESIDAIQLDLSYTAPAFRAGAGCVTTGPYTGTGNASTCALISSINNVGNLFYIQGTTYTPKAVLDIALNNTASEVFNFGVITRSLWVKETGAYRLTTAVIEVPTDSPGFPFSVYFTVYVCPAAATCAASGTPVLRSRVAFLDADPVTPVAGQRQVVVLSWSTLR